MDNQSINCIEVYDQEWKLFRDLVGEGEEFSSCRYMSNLIVYLLA